MGFIFLVTQAVRSSNYNTYLTVAYTTHIKGVDFKPNKYATMGPSQRFLLLPPTTAQCNLNAV